MHFFYLSDFYYRSLFYFIKYSSHQTSFFIFIFMDNNLCTYLGMERLIDQFHAIVREFRLKRHDLLDYHNNKFDRDYVEFNVKVRKFRLQFDF
jgi:Dynein heavy chain, N-terminal region 1